MSKALIEVRHCHRCKKEARAAIKRRVFGNGVTHFFWQCEKCKHSAEGPGKWIPKDEMQEKLLWRGITEEDIPLWLSIPDVECVVAGCTEIGSENHHIAPRALFKGDANLWPTVRLCEKHHTQWHLLVWPGDNHVSDAQWEAIKAEMRRESQQAAMEDAV